MPLTINDLSAAIGALVAAGYEVMFTESAYGGGQVDAYVMLNSATTVGTGPAPAAALAAVWPADVSLPGAGPACRCGHPLGEHTSESPDVDGLRGGRMCDREDCMCLAYRPADSAGGAR